VVLGLPRATIDDACRPGGVVVLLGPDPKEELGVLYLRLRHAVINDGVTLIELTPRASGLTKQASHRLHYHPGEVAALASALVAGSATKATAGIEPAVIASAAAALRGGAPVTVLLGRASLAESAGPVVDAALALRDGVGATVLSALRRGNVHGALDMGLAPGLLPGRATLASGKSRLADRWQAVPGKAGMDTRGILQAAADGRITTLVLLGADPLQDFPDRDPRRARRAGTIMPRPLRERVRSSRRRRVACRRAHRGRRQLHEPRRACQRRAAEGHAAGHGSP
jgi:NADH-quinone oxidoreductase subunit G